MIDFKQAETLASVGLGLVRMRVLSVISASLGLQGVACFYAIPGKCYHQNGRFEMGQLLLLHYYDDKDCHVKAEVLYAMFGSWI